MEDCYSVKEYNKAMCILSVNVRHSNWTYKTTEQMFVITGSCALWRCTQVYKIVVSAFLQIIHSILLKQTRLIGYYTEDIYVCVYIYYNRLVIQINQHYEIDITFRNWFSHNFPIIVSWFIVFH